MSSIDIWGRNNPEKAAERLEEQTRGGKAPAYTDVHANVDLPHGVFAARVRREARGHAHLGWGLPAIPPHLERPLAALIAEFPIATEFQPYLERGIASLQDQCATERAIEEYFDLFALRIRDHVAGLRLSVTDWAHFADELGDLDLYDSDYDGDADEEEEDNE
ncbi:MAG: hypothetical protein IPK59_10465 [Rhodospirillaceae bacterium]|nr:hypothetical protein [Rhodospirillaceae bacterium]